jgi:hypothetical protein
MQILPKNTIGRNAHFFSCKPHFIIRINLSTLFSFVRIRLHRNQVFKCCRNAKAADFIWSVHHIATNRIKLLIYQQPFPSGQYMENLSNATSKMSFIFLGKIVNREQLQIVREWRQITKKLYCINQLFSLRSKNFIFPNLNKNSVMPWNAELIFWLVHFTFLFVFA